LRSKFDDVCQRAESTATQWGAETTFKNTRIRTKKRFFEELSNDCRLETFRDRFRVNIFFIIIIIISLIKQIDKMQSYGCWHVLNAVANALRISAEHNWSFFMFVSGAANDSIWFWFARPTYKTDKEVQQWRFVWFVSTTAGVQSLCRRFHPENQESSRRIECHHESGNVCVFPRRGHGVHDIFDSSRERGKQRTQLLKAQAAVDIFASSGSSGNVCAEKGA